MELELEMGQSKSPGATPWHARGGLASVQFTAAIREACPWSGSNETTCWVPSSPCHPSSAWVCLARLWYYLDQHGGRTALSDTPSRKAPSTSRTSSHFDMQGSGRAAFQVWVKETGTSTEVEGVRPCTHQATTSQNGITLSFNVCQMFFDFLIGDMCFQRSDHIKIKWLVLINKDHNPI